jgi:hypothetical protein
LNDGDDFVLWRGWRAASGVDEVLDTLRFWMNQRCQWVRQRERGREKPEREAGFLNRASTDEILAAVSVDSGDQSSGPAASIGEGKKRAEGGL